MSNFLPDRAGSRHFAVRCLAFLISVVAAWVPGWSADEATLPATPPTITSFAEFWNEEFRNELRPIRIELVVTYFDPGWRNFWGEIDGRPGFLRCHSEFDITRGDRVLIEGRVQPSRGLDRDLVKVTVLERNVPLVPLDARGRLAEYSLFKERLVTVEAIFDRQRISSSGDHLELYLVAEGHQVRVYQWSPQPRLIDVSQGAILRVTGIYNAMPDPRTETTVIDLWITQSQDVQHTGTISADARFQRALTAIGELPRLAPTEAPRARIAGYVREYDPGVSISLRDATGQIIVRTLQTLPLQIGDRIEAYGEPFTWGTDWLLRNAIVRRANDEAIDYLASQPANNQLRMAAQVLELTPDQAARNLPVEMSGIVSWSNPLTDSVYLRDPSAGVLVRLNRDMLPPPKPGHRIRVVGTTAPGEYAPEVVASHIEPWGSGVALAPAPREITLGQAMTGLHQGQWVEMRGHVRRIERTPETTLLHVGTQTGEFQVRLYPDVPVQHLVGSIVAVRGVCHGRANNRRQLTGVEVWAHTLEEIRLEQVAPLDPFAVPLREIGSLRQFNPNAAQQRWVRVRGVVTYHLSNRLIFAQDGAEGVLILAPQGESLRPGDVIDATGLPGLQNQRIVLREAVYRKIDHVTEPGPVMVDDAHAISEQLESRLVRLHGRLINSVVETETIALAMQVGDTVASAFLARGPGRDRVARLLPGSRLELTGVYELVHDERGQPAAFRLQLRTPEDITILSVPSWWTTPRLLIVTGALLACITVVSAWSIALRRRVRAQTVQIRAQLVKEANLEAHNRDIVANASDAIFTTDESLRFTSFNPAGERMTGYTCEQVREKNLRELIAPEDAPQLEAHLARLRETQGTVTFQSRLRRHDGRQLWAETSLRLRREGERTAGVLGVVRDVSERKQVEEELRRARDAAEANTQAKSAFLANMSHEIRTPMNAVIGMSNLLLDTSLNEEQREFACTIRTGAESLLTLLNDILDFSRIEAGKLHFETLDFDLADTVDQTVEMLAPRAASKRLELAAYLPPGLPDKVRGDPGRLRQVLLNLVGNAIKFTDQGEVSLTVHLVEHKPGVATLMFEVRDTGIGIAAETVEKLFRPFSQADASMARRFGGAGLGLAISKQIVELMGGTIGVQSEPGRGSTFWFTVTLELQSDAAAVPSVPLEKLRGVRLLVVDGFATNRRIAYHHTQAWGMRCTVMPDVGSALAELRAAAAADPYRLLVADCALTGPGGLALARDIQSDAVLRGLPIVLLTSVDRRLSPEETFSLGVSTVLLKPLRVPELAVAVARALGAIPHSGSLMPPRTEPVRAGARHVGLRVLVAEDNVTNQRLIALQLGKLGCTVDIANHGLEVLEALERADYDLVFMDCQMPELDGFETTRRIRQSSRYGRVRVVAMTANAMEGDRERCLAAGMDEYLSKPVRPADLKATLQRAALAAAPVAS